MQRHYSLTKTGSLYCVHPSEGQKWCRDLSEPPAPWGAYIATPPRRKRPQEGKAHHLQFEFESPSEGGQGYFIPENVGHFHVGIRGDGVSDTDNDGIPNLRGQGIVIGSTHLYQGPAEGGPTPYPNTTAIETWWPEGSCLFGDTTYGVELTNDTRYCVRLSSSDDGDRPAHLIAYSLWKHNRQSWELLVERDHVDPWSHMANPNLSGWWIAEAGSEHDWTMHIDNVKEWWVTS